MKRVFGVLTVAFALECAVGSAMAADTSPAWAYGFASNAPIEAPARGGGRGAGGGGGGRAPDPTLKTVPGSALQFAQAQIGNRFGPADWFPGDHPTMPDVVAHGRMPDIFACSLCHYPNGKGRAENAGIAGLPVSYFLQTMADFRNGNRKSADTRKANTNNMIAFAKGMTDDEIKAAAEYFGSMKWTSWMKVIETDAVPKTRIAAGLFLTLDGNDKEPIAGRIIEVPENAEATETLRDPHSGFFVYTPTGSLKKGEALVKAGQCSSCHGADLRGLGPVPGIAGRSPSYMVRQMYDMQAGTRHGEWTELMKPVVARFSTDDMLAVAAYVASQKP